MNRISNLFILLSNKQQQYGNTRTSKILNWLPNVQLGDKILTQEKLPTTTDPGNKDIHPYLTLCPKTHFSVFSHIFLRLLPIALHCYCMVLHKRHLILFPFFHVPAFVGGGRIWPNRILLQLTRSFFKYQIFLDFSWTIQFLVQFQDISLLANLIHRLHLLLCKVSTNLVTHVKIVVTQGVDIHHPLYLLRDLSSFRGSMPGP